MTRRIAYLASGVTLPGSPTRRPDAFEHDQMMDALTAPMAAHGLALDAVRWDDAQADWAGYDGAIIGTTWDYWDRPEAFLGTLNRIERTTPLFNPSALVAWNSNKNYLRDLGSRGVALLPTLWLDRGDRASVAAAFDALGAEDIVVKRQVGAGAVGQARLRREDPIPETRRAMMAQPYLPAIEEEGELSFVFIDGALSHALVKRPAPGDYRIQSAYGGVEIAITPTATDHGAAAAVLDALETVPLYARVDMLRGRDGDLRLMELELIEPFLYPLQGPELGARLAAGLAARLR